MENKSEALNKGHMYDVTGLNLGEGPDLPADQEGGKKVPVPSYIRPEQLDDFRKRKAAYLEREAANMEKRG